MTLFPQGRFEPHCQGGFPRARLSGEPVDHGPRILRLV
jgi:hypothetical protein